MKKTIISSVAALALIVGVGSASAQTMTAAEMQAMIAQLTAQLALLSGTTTTPTMSSYVHPGVTLRVGSKGVAVTALQNALNNLGFSAGKADGVYGKGTAAAVKAFQMSKGLGADGVAGNNTHGALVIALSGTTTTPTVPGTTGTLQGGAGTATVSVRNSGTLSKVAEGKDDQKVAGFEIKATGSDVNVTNLSLELKNTNNASNGGSFRVDRYIKEVVVMQDNKEVGSLSINGFDRNSSTNLYTGQVSLSNVVIKKDETARFFIAVSTNSVIDSSDMNAMIDVKVSSGRYNDATGAVLTLVNTTNNSFGFEKATDVDGAKVLSSSSNPVKSNIEVEKSSISDEAHILSFRVKGDTNSSRVNVLTLPVNLTVKNTTGVATSGTTIAKVVDDIYLKVGNTIFDKYTVSNAQVSAAISGTGANTSATASYIFDIEEGDFEISAGDTTEVKVYAKFNGSENYFSGKTTVEASVTGSEFYTENQNGDKITMTGGFTGDVHTLAEEAPNFSFVSSAFTAAKTGTDATSGTISLTFKVDATSNDVKITETGAANIVYTLPNATGKVEVASCENSTTTSGQYTVYEGQTRNCTLTVKFATLPGFAKLSITSIDGVSVDLKTPNY